MKIAIFARDINEKWRKRLSGILNALDKRGILLTYYRPFYLNMCDYDYMKIPQGALFTSESDLPSDTDIFLCFGGDGTFLESLTIIRDKDIPVAGVNFGRLGFLTSVDLKLGDEWIDRILSGDFLVEKRGLLSIETTALPKGFCKYALNEVSFQRKDPSMLTIHVKINGMELPPYWSDGLVLASPTGSTAYSLSVGGPIALPGVRALILAPIAPHNLNVRPLVVSDDSVIEIFVESRWGEAILSLDNRSLTIPVGVKVTISKANFDLKYISLTKGGFINALREKLMWGEDKRNI
ncbi:MAG: NAD(+) kinase [Bacteroidetes bacterium HGW-Bacteroidetes-5]|jgi:NAD+ kinase|nr:MAG: NAD(+) kinase [Bacteroidetes bacterium HGW-Bacteroidetes-5]